MTPKTKDKLNKVFKMKSFYIYKNIIKNTSTYKTSAQISVNYLNLSS